MQVAVVSTDGVNVNEHFGKADRFFIYEINPSGRLLMATRQTEPLSTGDRRHPFDQERFDKVAAALAGCKKVFCTRIGDRPAEELQKLGIEPEIYKGPIAGITL